MAEETALSLRSATSGFDALFANDIEKAREIFSATESPFHSLGAGVCAFLEAALGMEVRTAICFARYGASQLGCYMNTGWAYGNCHEAAFGRR